MRVAFLHPDLGLGGAERLIVDAAAGLAARGHSVTVFTSHFDEGRCFSEAVSGVFAVRVAGAWLPRAFFGRLHVLFAVARMLWLALFVVLGGGGGGAWDVLVVDQVSAPVPLLRLLAPRARVLFYAHFPDLLLAPRGGSLRAAYRAPFDALEQVTTGLAHGVLVNSHFTGKTFRDTFSLLTAGAMVPRVLYPCVEIKGGGAGGADSGAGGRAPSPHRLAVGSPRHIRSLDAPSALASSKVSPSARSHPQSAPRRILLSINRYERKKDLAVLLRAFAAAQPSPDWHLVLAGGYDERLSENVEHFEELCALAVQLNLTNVGWGEKLDGVVMKRGEWPAGDGPAARVGSQVTFLRSVSDAQKLSLLRAAAAVAYTPRNEHFGIVPLECMAAERPVIASASGGPLESVVDGVTGILCDGSDGWRDALKKLLALSDSERARMGAAGLKHVLANFSRPAFAAALEAHAQSLVAKGAWTRAPWLEPLLWFYLGCLLLSPFLAAAAAIKTGAGR